MKEVRAEEISNEELGQMTDRLVAQLQSMTVAQKQIVFRSEESLGFYIAGAFRLVAEKLGYILTMPVVWLGEIVQQFWSGFGAGARAAVQTTKKAREARERHDEQ